MAVSLLLQVTVSTVAWLRIVRMTDGILNHLPRPTQFFVRHGWLLATLPIGEAAVLAAGGFWA